MTKVITFAIQKGGSAKTTSAAITAYLLSEQGYRVLAVDMDSQGNLTELLFKGQINDIYDFHQQTVLEAMKAMDATRYLHPVNDNLHMLTAEDLLATLPKYLWTEVRGNAAFTLKKTLKPVMDKYDYIIIDTPPALGDHTMNALAVSDAVVIMFETGPFCYSALPRFIETVGIVQKHNKKLEIAGILRTMQDNRRNDSKDFSDLVEAEYGTTCFDTVIKRIAATGRLPIKGFYKAPAEVAKGVEQYIPFVEEMLNRVGKPETTIQ